MIDVLIISLYLIAVMYAGFAFSGSNRTEKDYFLANRSMHWSFVGISIMVTAFSTLNFVSVTAEDSRFGLYVLLSIPMFFIVYYPVSRYFIPFYRKLDVTSAYEYLEVRFDRRTRTAAAVMFLVWKIIWMAVSLYAAGAALSALSGIPLPLVIVIAGVTALAYTVNGGIRAVIVTDMMQFFVLFTGIAAILAAAYFRYDGGFAEIFELAGSKGSLSPFSPFDPSILSPSMDVRISVWSTFLGVAVAFMARYGVDQVVVQRYFTARSEKDVRKGFLLNACAAVLIILMIAMFGIFVKAHAVSNGLNLPPLKAMASLINSMPRGIPGILSAGLLAAMMSSIDSGINSCSTSFFKDIYPVINPSGSAFTVKKGKIVSLVIGNFSIIAAFPVGQLGTIFETVNKVINGMGAPLLALFIAGMTSKKITADAAVKGFIAGTAASIFIISFVDGISLHYYAVINFVSTFALIHFFGYKSLKCLWR